MDTAKLLAQLSEHEGFVGHGYRDSLGFLTIGFGRLIDERKGGGISKGEGLYLLQNDVAKVRAQLDAMLPWWTRLDEVRQRVVADMAFNLGITGLMGFRRTLAHMQAGNYELAAEAMLESRWASQVGRRATRLAQMMRTGADV